MMRLTLVLMLVLTASVMALGQTREHPSKVAEAFLQMTFEGDLSNAGRLSNGILIADGRSFGPKSDRPILQALQELHASRFEYHKELSIDITDHRAKIMVEMVRSVNNVADIEIFEILLIPSNSGWKIFGWRKVTNSIERVRPLQPIRPLSFPRSPQCPTCV